MEKKPYLYSIKSSYKLYPDFQVYFCKGKNIYLATLLMKKEKENTWKCISEVGIVYLERGQMMIDNVTIINNKIVSLCL